MGDNVLIYYPHISEYGGLERTIIALSESATLHGLNTVLLCHYDLVGMERKNLKVIQLGNHWNPFRKALRLRRWVLKNASSLTGMPLVIGCKAVSYAAMCRMRNYALLYPDPPSLLTANSLPKTTIRRFRTYVSDLFRFNGVAKASHRITMTEWNANELKEMFGKEFRVIYMGGASPISKFQSHERGKRELVRWFSICRMASSKNLSWIMDAAVRFISETECQSGLKLEITIAGEGPERSNLEKYASDLGLSSIVRFPGFLTPEQVEEQFEFTDLFLVPGRQGFGLPVLESLYRRVPVVLNRESRVSEILADNPWVRISEHSSVSFSEAVYKHFLQLRYEKYPSESSLAELPSEASWALKVGKVCHWW